MKDNTVTTVDGVEVYTSQITEIADRYIADLEDIDSIYTYEVFTDLLLYISDNMTPLNNYNDITVLDNLFNIYKRLCSKYRVLPTLYDFSMMINIDPSTITRWMNGETRGGLTSEHCKTAKKWKQYCAGRLASNLSNSKGTDANKIFIAKAAYGMAETKAVEQEQITGARKTVEQIAKDIGADELPDFGDPEDDADAFDF
nr:MAG TPA: DNA-binding protein [Caudoviricetes sp.]